MRSSATATASSALDESGLKAAVIELVARDADLARAVRDHGPPPLWGRPQGFGTLLHVILEQQVSLASARSAYQRLCEAIGNPEPSLFLELGDARLKQIGFSRQKARYGRALALALLDGRLDLTALAAADDRAARRQLMALPGIGRWTADIYLLMALRRPDVWPRGDLALVKSARGLLSWRGTVDDRALARRALAWRPWRAVAARILWHNYLSER